MSVALCMIVRDGVGDGLERAIASARPWVDEVCVWENGSTDGTRELLDRIAATPGAPLRVEHGTWTDDFAAAREASFAMTAAEWIVHFDANDELRGGSALAEILLRADASRADAVWVAFDHQMDPLTLVPKWLWWPRVVRRGTGRWVGRVHELWTRKGIDRWRYGVGQGRDLYAHPATLSLYHHDRAPQPRLKYHAILELAATEDPQRTPLALKALGQECLHVDDARAVELLERYLAKNHDRAEGTPNSTRAQVMLWLADACDRLGRHDRAAHWRRQWDRYSQWVTRSLGPSLPRVVAMLDDYTVTEWASQPAADLLLAP